MAFRARAPSWCRARNHVGTACGSDRQLDEMLAPELGAMSAEGAATPLSRPPSTAGDAPAPATLEPRGIYYYYYYYYIWIDGIRLAEKLKTRLSTLVLGAMWEPHWNASD